MVTHVRIEEIFMAKAILGFVLSFFMGILILLLNKAFDTEPVLLGKKYMFVGLLAETLVK